MKPQNRLPQTAARRNQGGSVTSSLNSQVRELGNQVQEAVDTRPILSVCAAFAGGLAIGVGAVALYCQLVSEAVEQRSMTESLTDRLTKAINRVLPSQYQYHS